MSRFNYAALIHRRSDKNIFIYHPLVIALCLGGYSSSRAEDYFDPAFLGENTQVDLSVFANPGGVAEGEYTVNVFMNQQSVGEVVLNFRKNAQGQIAPLLTLSQLEQWGIDVNHVPELKNLPPQTVIEDLAEYIPQAVTKLNLARLRLDISVPQIAMQPSYGNWADPHLWEDGIPALLANYNISAGRTTNTSGQQKTTNDNVFASFRMGANAGPWRLRSTMTHSYSNNSGGGNTAYSHSQTKFSNTYLSRDIRGLRSTLLVGESSTGSEVIDGIPFKGIKLSSNEQMLPNQLRGFAPVVSGVANSNARITVRQNGNIVYETYVAPGPFSINDIQQSGMSGDYDVTVTEADGTERQFIVPYSSLPMMLRPGGWKYELTGGRYNGGYTSKSRNADFILFTGVYGLPKNITVYGGTLLSGDYHAASGGMGVSLGDIGAMSADITHSSSKFEHGNTLTGQSYRLRYSKSLLSTGTSVDLTALRYSTEHYYSFNEFNSEGYRLSDGVSPWTGQRRRSSFQTQLSQQMGDWGSLSFRASRDDYWGSDRTLTGLSLGYSNNVRGINYGIHYNIDRVKSDSGQWPENRQLSVSVNIPFSIFGSSSALQSVYATTSVSHDNHGRTQNQAGLSGYLPDSRVNYNLSQSWGNQGQTANSNLNAGYQGSKGTLSAGYSYSNDSRSINMNAGGGLVMHSEGITLSNTLGDPVALISAPDAPGVRVTNGNSFTDWRGYAIAPYLSAYTKNSVGLDPSTLPDDVELVQSNINVYPTKGAVVKATFATRVGYQVLMTLKHNKTVVPFGAVASLMSEKPIDENSSIVGDSGQVYMAGLPESGRIFVKWGQDSSQRCIASFNISKLILSPDVGLRQVTLQCLSRNQTEVKSEAEVIKPSLKNESAIQGYAAGATEVPSVPVVTPKWLSAEKQDTP
ncbi:fimbria/pilus outer membrane usher protein [Morganella morganii]|nr:fimbrial biogenesis outer membrane usher protein [Morganella morganii]